MHCASSSRGDAEEFPTPKPPPDRPRLAFAAAALTRRDGSVLLRRHPEGELFAGTWDLPGRMTDGEAPGRSARSALRACGAEGFMLRACGNVSQTLTHRNVHIALFRGEGDATEREGLRFFAPGNLGSVGLSSLARKCLRACGVGEATAAERDGELGSAAEVPRQRRGVGTGRLTRKRASRNLRAP
jgi:adenine-specific DNA glycosylase